MDNDKPLLPIKKYETLSPSSKDKISSSVKKYEVLSPINKDTTSLPINCNPRVYHGFAEKNRAKPSSALIWSQKGN